jgi:hypothetical protein
VQEGVEKEIIVCDNSDNVGDRLQIQGICGRMEALNGTSIRYVDVHREPPVPFCYHGLEVGPVGDWLCFPSDDSYYVPKFASIMLGAAVNAKAEFVLCDVIYDPRLAYAKYGTYGYSIMRTSPGPGAIDKTSFIISRNAFSMVGGWPPHDQDWRDGMLAEAVVGHGFRWYRLNQPMVVHN